MALADEILSWPTNKTFSKWIYHMVNNCLLFSSFRFMMNFKDGGVHDMMTGFTDVECTPDNGLKKL